MLPVPEMASFGERYGFAWKAHEKGEANRSAHVERGFDHVDKNFFAGRQFATWEEASDAAKLWCDKVNTKYRRELSATAREVFAAERSSFTRTSSSSDPPASARPDWSQASYSRPFRMRTAASFCAHKISLTNSMPRLQTGRPANSSIAWPASTCS